MGLVTGGQLSVVVTVWVTLVYQRVTGSSMACRALAMGAYLSQAKKRCFSVQKQMQKQSEVPLASEQGRSLGARPQQEAEEQELERWR